MSLYKRKDSSVWWIKLTVNGRRIQTSTGTDDRKQAQEYHDRLKAELWEQSRLGVKPGYLWQEAVVRWLEETQHKASQSSDQKHFRWLDAYLKGVRLMDIDRDKVDQLISAKKAEGVSNATVNRMLALVRSVLRRAIHEWEWLESMPKVRLLAEPKLRIRFLTREEAERLLEALPLHWADMARFSLETGLRQSNVFDLHWSQVDLDRKVAWVHPDQAKARKAICVPLSEVAAMVVRSQSGKHDAYVFSFRGKPITALSSRVWSLALQRAGIENFRWHDLGSVDISP